MDEKTIRKYFGKLGITGAVKSRGWVNCHCPFAPWKHVKGSDTTPSFGVKIERGKSSAYYCFTCKSHGHMHDLVAELGRYRQRDYSDLTREVFIEDARMSFTWEDVTEQPEEELTPLQEEAFAGLYAPAWGYREAREYLEGRGVSEATAIKLELGYDPEEQRVTFPVRGHAGELYGFTGRGVFLTTAKERKVKDYLGLPKRELLLGEHLAKPGLPSFVVEGLFGYAHLFEIGANAIVNPLAIMGSAMTDAKVHRLEELGERVFLAVDPDEGGETCLWGPRLEDEDLPLSERPHKGNGAVDKLYRRVPMYIPDWPIGVDDPDQLALQDVEAMLAETSQYVKPIQTKRA